MVLVDQDNNGRLTEPEVAAAEQAVFQYLQRYLQLRTAGETCPVQLADYRVHGFSNLQLHLRYTCPEVPTMLQLSSGLFAGTDHKYQLQARFVGDRIDTAVTLSRHNNTVQIQVGQISPQQQNWVGIFLGIALAVLLAAGVLLLHVRRSKR